MANSIFHRPGVPIDHPHEVLETWIGLAERYDVWKCHNNSCFVLPGDLAD
jgi:hypothetical protein